MARILSKYTRSKDLTQNVVYESQQEYMTAIANGLKITAAGDINRPYSFREWYDKQTALIPGDEYKQYNSYLNEWYSSRKAINPQTIDTSNVYFSFIQQLQVLFRNTDDERFLDLDINNPAELVDAAPYYARKLKDIARYLIYKREAIKRAKLKYNMSGATQAIERLFYEYLLKAFTKNKIENEYTVIPELSVLEQLPDLSAVAGSFQINVEELYDDSSYFDRDPQISAVDYFSYTPTVSAYLANYDITTIDQFEWLYDTGVSQLCSNNPWLWVVDDVIAQYEAGNIPLSAIEDTTSNILNDYGRIALAQKYLGEDQYIISGGYYIPWTKNLTLPMVSGNNWFYWPSGSTDFFITQDLYVDPIALSSTSLLSSGATPASSYREADVIFVQRGSDISGAWLQSPFVSSTVVTMSAKLMVGSNIFVYPFPGFGLSGDDINWTGRELNNLDYTFNYLDDDTKQAIYNAYWAKKQDSNQQFTPLSIHQTTLIDNGAHANINFVSADSIIANSGLVAFEDVYQKNKTVAWLYKLTATNIPILNGTNYIYWPYEKYTGTPILNNLLSGTQICEDIALTSIPGRLFCGACAADAIGNADMIFKIDSPNGMEKEAAWLSGINLSSIYTDVTGTMQAGIAFRANAGVPQPFLWNNSDTEINQFIYFYPHRDDCPFKETDNWKDCECKAVYYSPHGHSGSDYNDSPFFADIIIVDTQFPNEFDLSTWRGRDNLPYNQSRDFAWFKTTSGMGWKPGSWVTGDGSEFECNSGVRYKYIRANLKQDEEVPYIIINHGESSHTQWIKAIKNEKNKWVSLDVVSDMVIKQNDYLKYNHKSSRSVTNTASSIYLSAVTTVDYLPEPASIWTSTTLTTTGSQMTIGWPSHANYGEPGVTAQLPPVFASALCAISITYTINGGAAGTLVTNGYVNPKSFIPQATGVYAFNITGRTWDGSIVTPTYVPPVSVFSPTDMTMVAIVSNANVGTLYRSINFVLNVPLSGWDYTLNSYTGTAPGIRPLWVEGTVEREDQTRYKGINIWGGSPYVVGDYLLLSQTPVSQLILNTDLPIEYNRKTLQNIYWIQPIGFTEYIYEGAAWKKLIIDTDSLLSYKFKLNDLDSVSVTGTDIDSDIILDVLPDVAPLSINYYANSNFTWNQTLLNSTLGVPPTGGLWVPIASSQLVEANTPHAHFTNRHYPTYASAPYIGNLYSIEDVGGYFIPSMLGVSIALSRDTINALSTHYNIMHGQTAVIFQALNKYAMDRGLTLTSQFTPVSTIETNAEWMKSGVTTFGKAGVIKDAVYYQDLAPYQTSYETKRTNNYGVFRHNDINETWQKYTTYSSSSALDWPVVTNQYLDDILKYNELMSNFFNIISPTNIPATRYLYKWKTDIFGNQYALYKLV